MSGLSESTEKWLADVAEKYPSKMAALREAVRETQEACAVFLDDSECFGEPRCDSVAHDDLCPLVNPGAALLALDIGAEVQKKESFVNKLPGVNPDAMEDNMTLFELMEYNKTENDEPSGFTTHDLAVLADWAHEWKEITPNKDWKRAYSLIREGADLLLRRRARLR